MLKSLFHDPLDLLMINLPISTIILVSKGDFRNRELSKLTYQMVINSNQKTFRMAIKT